MKRKEKNGSEKNKQELEFFGVCRIELEPVNIRLYIHVICNYRKCKRLFFDCLHFSASVLNLVKAKTFSSGGFYHLQGLSYSKELNQK